MYCNIATYKFITLNENELPSLCKRLKKIGTEYSIKGTILLSVEGINLFLASEKTNIEQYQQYLDEYPFFKDLIYKYSYSDFIPFKKLFVKVRKEIVTFKQSHIQPEKFTAPYISPHELKECLDQQQQVTLLDTRNIFEYEVGTFENAIHLNIKNFREFPEALKQSQNLDKNIPVITFCTGGIRCEKAAAYLLEQGFKEVYQLQGGILNYFEHCKDEYFQGNCFVFDDRIAVNSRLEPVQIKVETLD